jgi:hypothetical protein
MNVYRDTNTDVIFEHPFAGPLVATIYRNGIVQRVSSSIAKNANRFTLPLTYVDTQFDGKLDIEWASADRTFIRTTSIEVVTPLVPLSRLREVFSTDNWADGDLKELENKVRIYIQSWTQQTYGYEIATYSVVGNGDQRLPLPRRLIQATNIASTAPGYFGVSSDGWELYIRNKNWLTVKEMPPEEYTWVTHGVIYVPDSYWKAFRVGARYDITGEWGYYSVPEDVQEAALILAKNYACDDSEYRDRYLSAVKAGDGNLTFDPGAFRATGNVRADQLLEPYRRQGMVII